MKKTIIALVFFVLLQIQALGLFAVYLEKAPVTVKQPDGTTLKLYATGDEYYNWLCDEDGYTVVINPQTKYYCYAKLKDNELVASTSIVGKSNPQRAGLKPNINLPVAKINEIKKNAYDYMHVNDVQKSTPSRTLSKATTNVEPPFHKINNIVIYIRFADQAEFTTTQSYYTSIFNGFNSSSSCLRNYFKEASYGKLEINTSFYPTNNGTNVISYQDIYESGYYLPIQNSAIGYSSESERTDREQSLLSRAINSVKSQIPTTIDLDNNNDGKVDNICFIVRGGNSSWNTLLWPHKWCLYTRNVYINGKKVHEYNFQIEDFLSDNNVGVLCHEMNHTLGAPDLYHYYDVNYGTPIGNWCLMANDLNPPQHICAYVKYRYDRWIPEIQEITTSGTYSLNPLTSSTNNCYKIAIKNSSEYLVLEYRRKTGLYENRIYGSGLVIYRVNESYTGNAGGSGFGGGNDMIYVFRPNGSLNNDGNISSSFLSAQSGRDSFSNTTNPHCFISNGNNGNIYIKNIKESNGKVTFDVRFCDGVDIVKSNTNNLPELTNASNSISTQNTVVVKNTDNVIFEAANHVTINSGFEVKLGGEFTITMNGCGEK